MAISLPGPLFAADVYSQNTIEEIANSRRLRLDLLDSLINTRIWYHERSTHTLGVAATTSSMSTAG
jgi:hypothetical protein